MKKLNEQLRSKLTGIPVSQISNQSGIAAPNISNWFKGLDFGYKQLQKLANAYDYEIFAEIRIKI